jgi:hypothetical protein
MQIDPQQQHAANVLAGLGAGFFIVMFLVIVVFLAFMVFCLWRIFTKAGLAAPLSLLIFVPGFGGLIVLCILAFADWKVVPVASYGALPPQYPPQYPPPSPTL